jgi:hypothetical protein
LFASILLRIFASKFIKRDCPMILKKKKKKTNQPNKQKTSEQLFASSSLIYLMFAVSLD